MARIDRQRGTPFHIVGLQVAIPQAKDSCGLSSFDPQIGQLAKERQGPMATSRGYDVNWARHKSPGVAPQEDALVPERRWRESADLPVSRMVKDGQPIGPRATFLQLARGLALQCPFQPHIPMRPYTWPLDRM